MRPLLSGSLAALLLTACDVTKTDFPVRTEAVRAEVEELATDVTIVRLTADNIASFSAPPGKSPAPGGTTLPASSGWTYRVGPGDILSVTVWDHPDLTMPAGAQRSAQDSGQRVQADGRFFYPYVGQIDAKGRTPEAIRDELTQKLAAYIPNPQVEVRVVGYNSQAVSITGEVKNPSRRPLTDTPLTLLDAIDAAGGLTDSADPRAVSLRRAGTLYSVDLDAFLQRGHSAGNPILRPGDVVSVPRREQKEAYLLGQILRPATIDLTRDPVTLTQAITRVGGLKEDSADARGIFVFRNTQTGITVYQLEASNPVAYLIGTKFLIQPQDVIYVTSAPLHRWNRLISSLLPSLTTARIAEQFVE